MKSRLSRTTHKDLDGNVHSYDCLVFICPGCATGSEGYEGIHRLPVEPTGTDIAHWDFDGNLEAPTVEPSILTHFNSPVFNFTTCHSFLRNGVFEFLNDSDHSLSGQHVPIPDLPEWAEELS